MAIKRNFVSGVATVNMTSALPMDSFLIQTVDVTTVYVILCLNVYFIKKIIKTRIDDILLH